MDETKGEKKTVRIAYVTICLDLERRREVNFIKMYEGQFPSLSTIYVVNDALRSCRGTPIIITDHAPLVQIRIPISLRLDYIQKTFGIRNYIERWYRTFKQRTKGDFTITFLSKIL